MVMKTKQRLGKENGGWKWWGWPVEVLYWVGLYYTGLPTQFLNYLMEFI